MNYLNNMLNSIGAASKFQKHRLIFTNKNDMESPNLKSLKQLLNTFAGNDNQTQPALAFATIKRKILYSDSNNSWIYLIKNLIIFDQAIQRHLLLECFVDLDLPTINQFKQIDKRFLQFYFDGIIRKFFLYMKLKAKILVNKHSIFKVQKSLQQQILNKLSIQECKWCVEIAESVFKSIFQIFQYKKYGVAQFKLIQYVFSQLLIKLYQWCYSIGLLCFTKFSNIIQTFSQAQVIAFEKKFDNFKKLMTKAIELGQQFKWINTKPINSKEFESNINLIYKFINQYKSQQKSKQIQRKSFQHEQIFLFIKKSIYENLSSQWSESLLLKHETSQKINLNNNNENKLNLDLQVQSNKEKQLNNIHQKNKF